MSFLFLISQILIYTALAAIFLWGLKLGISLIVFSRKKEELHKLLARISVLKLHLRGKIKRKCNKIEQIFLKEPPETLNLLKPKLTAIAGLEFNSPSDYQLLIGNLSEITQAIINHIKLKHKSLLKAQKAESFEKALDENHENDEVVDNCKKLVKYDKGTMTVIVELIETTDKVIVKIAEYNALAEFDKKQKKFTDIPSQIKIENLDVISSLLAQAKNGDLGGTEVQILGKDTFGDAA